MKNLSDRGKSLIAISFASVVSRTNMQFLDSLSLSCFSGFCLSILSGCPWRFYVSSSGYHWFLWISICISIFYIVCDKVYCFSEPPSGFYLFGYDVSLSLSQRFAPFSVTTFVSGCSSSFESASFAVPFVVLVLLCTFFMRTQFP